ncbi:MAG: Glycosyl hydrolase family 76 [Pelotomaculum sp. PtaU1.Bin035]|nr:MAG: Glycosyl hydrolase family 76 [Pelotomaculum sp. PtaU1.Bin035]
MERECFEDEEVAVLLNEHFVSIKVDREERPDVDHVYMTVCQALTGSGGWPLTIIMSPDKKPFFSGTYFPKHSSYGRPGLMDVLGQIQHQWQTNSDKIIEAGEKNTGAVKLNFQGESHGKLDENTLHGGYLALKNRFDRLYGGFGDAPKFPAPHNLAFLLRYWKWKGEEDALSMVEKTLQAMHNGGIYDHLGFGFARYSVDRQWLVPHFEKMLYDNALLAMVYLEAYQITAREQYAKVAREIFRYVTRDMKSSEGAFFSAEDADSEGEEGKFYVWTPREIKEILGEETGSLFCQWYGVTEKGNFKRRNILNRVDTGKRPVNPAMDQEAWNKTLEESREKLFAVRGKRIHPYKDNKILTSWNSLMIAALSKGSRILQEPDYLEDAVRASDFIWSRLRRCGDSRLLARYRDDESAYLAYIDDYAYLIWAMLELYQADPRPLWLESALELQEDQNRLFWDSANGGYFFYGSDGEELFARPKEIYDGATPSGNSVSALNLLRLARLTNRNDFAEMAEKMFESFSGDVNSYPAGHAHFLMALLFDIVPGKEVVIVAGRDKDDVRRELKPLDLIFAPDTVFLYRLRGDEFKKLDSMAPFVQGMVSKEGKTTFYICRNFACRQPTTELAEVQELLQS